MDDDCPAGDVAERRPTPPEAVRRTVRRDVVEDLPEQHTLEMLEQWLWLFDEAHPTAGFGYPAVTVMAQALVGDRALEAFGVGEPVQVGAGEAEQVPQVVNGAKVRHRPWCRSHGGLEKENPLDRQDGPPNWRRRPGGPTRRPGTGPVPGAGQGGRRGRRRVARARSLTHTRRWPTALCPRRVPGAGQEGGGEAVGHRRYVSQGSSSGPRPTLSCVRGGPCSGQHGRMRGDAELGRRPWGNPRATRDGPRADLGAPRDAAAARPQPYESGQAGAPVHFPNDGGRPTVLERDNGLAPGGLAAHLMGGEIL